MHVTETLVRHVARLARIELSDGEVAAMVPQLDRILGHVEAVANVDVADADPASADAVPSAALRPDVAVPSLERRVVLRNAPATDQVFFLAPKVLED